jgi:hypothetical protein
MADLKSIQGFNIQNLDEDPTDTNSGGQVYYNKTSGQFKSLITGGAPIGTWASGGALNTPNTGHSGFGLQTAAISCGGQNPTPYSQQTESYNGTSWTIVNNMPGTRYGFGSAGTQTAGLAFGKTLGGAANDSTVSWDGTNWTEVQEGVGTQTNALSIGGAPNKAETEEWNGSSWSEENDLNSGGYGRASFGSYTSAIAAGLNTPSTPARTVVELWDGTSWTETTEINTNRYYAEASSNSPDNTSGIIFGGRTPAPGATATTEFWNGTTWTEVNDLATGRWEGGGAGTTNSALMFGGQSPPTTYTNTEEFTAAEFEIKTITTS